MNENEQHTGFRKWGRRILWVFAVFLGLLIILRLSLKTDTVQNWVKDYVVATANQQLNAELSIDQLSGDLLREVNLSGLRLMQEDTLAQIDSIYAAYNIWSAIGGQIEISDLIVYQPRVNLRQEKGQWNVQDLIPESRDTTGTLSLDIDNFELRKGAVSVQSDSLPVESYFTIDTLMLSSSLNYRNENYSFHLRDLSFLLENTELDQPLKVQTSATAQENSITLDQLILATGNSMIYSSGYASPPDSSIRFNFSASPVSWRDIASYVHDFPLRENLQIDLSLSGNPEQFKVILAMESPALNSFQISSRFQWGSSLVLQGIEMEAQFINFAGLLADTTLPSLQDLSAVFSGRIDVANYRQGQGDFTFSANDISRDPYRVDRLSGKGSLHSDKVTLDVEARTTDQRATAEVQVEQLWEDLPVIQSKINAANIDPGYWVQDSSYAGNISFRTEFSGRGWYPQERPWNYSVRMNDSRFMGQSISAFSAEGKVSGESGNMDARIQLLEGETGILADWQNLNGTPTYSYQIRARDLDLGGLAGTEEFNTALNGEISGSGRGFDLASMRQKTSVTIDSSLVNNELVRRLSADLLIRDSVAVVDTARLQSAIAEGSFSLRMNLLDWYHPKNELSVDLLLKELQTLAPLADVEELSAEGRIDGKLSPLENENLRFSGTVDLSNLKYNELFAAERAEGFLDITLQPNVKYLADLNLVKPTFSGVQLQNFGLETRGIYADSVARGQYKFQFSGTQEQRIEQAGSYSLAKDSISVMTKELKFISDYRTLSLEKPFELLVRNDTLRMDTMRISSGNEAFLEMGIPLATANEQHGYVRGKSLNTSVIQNSLFGKTFLGGMLSGYFEISRKDTAMNARGDMQLTEITYQGSDFDSLSVEGRIENERLEGTLSLKNGGKQLIDGEADLPFKLGNPEKFPASFYGEPVSGRLQMQDIAIEQFDSLFAEAGITETTGLLTFRGKLDGTAGQPDFTADVRLEKATLSGIPVDSVTAGVNYRHGDAELALNASVISMQQKAAQISARIPLFIDTKSFYVELPEDQDSLLIDIETNNFNLVALNDFLDDQTYQQVSGRLNGMVHIYGEVEDLKTDGQLTLDKGTVRLVPAGIRIDNIRAEVDFFSNQIRLTNFSARSGKGNLQATGVVAVEQLVPGGIDISVEAENFRAANTPQYNAVINLDSRIQGEFTQPDVNGSLEFISGFIELQNFGEKSVEKVQLDSLEEESEPAVSYYDSLALDMSVSFNRRFYIRNQRYLDMEVELDGDVSLVKEQNQDLKLFGSINTPDGYASPFGKQFNLQEGTVTFTGDPTNPKLHIRTRYEPPQTQESVVIWYIIEGTVENPQFKYESQPPMELENMISYTLFGQPFYALDSWKQVVASSGSNTTAADVALDVLLDRVEALATQKLGIDVVRIENSSAGGETGTSITTGWYLNPKVFFAIQNVITGSTPDTGFLLEYMLREDLKLIIKQGYGIREGIDLKWNYDY